MARISVVNYNGHILKDYLCKPNKKVKDYRTEITGIKASDLINSPDFDFVRSKIIKLIKDKIVIGHSIYQDFESLNY